MNEKNIEDITDKEMAKELGKSFAIIGAGIAVGAVAAYGLVRLGSKAFGNSDTE